MWQQTQSCLPAKFPKGEGTCCICICPGIGKMYLSQWSWSGVGGAYLYRRGTIYTNTADGLVYMCVFALIQLGAYFTRVHPA